MLESDEDFAFDDILEEEIENSTSVKTRRVSSVWSHFITTENGKKSALQTLQVQKLYVGKIDLKFICLLCYY